MPAAFIVTKEERTISQDRPTDRTAKLVTVKGTGLGAWQIKELTCIERRVPDEFENLPVHVVAAALGSNGDHARIIWSVGGEEEPLVNLELVDGRNREIQRRLAETAARSGHAVDHEASEVLLDSVNDDGAVGMTDLESCKVGDR